MQDISDQITSNKKKHHLAEIELKKLKTFDASYFRGKNYFDNNSKNYLVFEASLSLKGGASYNSILSWDSKGVTKEIIKPSRSNNNILLPKIEYIDTKERVKFNGDCLIQDQITYAPKTIVSIYIVHEITKRNPTSSYPTLENCLFGAAKLTKNPDIDNYKYLGYVFNQFY